MNFTDYVQKHPSSDKYFTAEAIMDDLGLSVDQKDVLRTVIANAVVFVERGLVRQSEQTTSVRSFDKPVPAGQPAPSRELLNMPVYVNHIIGKVLWGDMTLPQWELRRDFLEEKIHGITKSVDKVNEAIDLLKRTGVKCLRLVPTTFEVPSADGEE